VQVVRAKFRTRSAELPHEERIRLEQEYALRGFLDFKSQTAQVPSSVDSTNSNFLLILFFVYPKIGSSYPLVSRTFILLLAIFY